MEFGFKILKFPAFEHILGTGSEGLPSPVQLELGGIEADPRDVTSVYVQMMVETLLEIDEIPNQYIFTAKSVRTLNTKKPVQMGHSHILWETAVGVYDRHSHLGVIELCESKDSRRLDLYRAIASNDLGTRRLMKAIGFIP